MFKRVPGTRDILPGETECWQNIENISRSLFTRHNYREIRTPLLEDEPLFNRSLGETAEIVQKQMFLIKREHDVYALRPEGTASIVRAYIENNLDKQQGFVKLYYMGPMFRAERPQKGRLRQFHHIGCEAIGSYGPGIDAEVIVLADSLLKALGISGYRIALNSLGCVSDQQAFRVFLKDKLSGRLNDLCADCKDRFGRNILRVLDCKNDSCRHIIRELNISGSSRCAECESHFSSVRRSLDALGVSYEISPNLVRGLDYYNRTVFEFKHDGLGPQQDALGAGGRYDGLVKQLGGPDAGAIGFAFGVERLILASGLKAETEMVQPGLVYVITLGDRARAAGVKLLADLRGAGVTADTDYEGKSLKAAMRTANDLKARFVAILGDDELKEGVVALKDMSNSSQEKVRISELTDKIKGSSK
ncbi:MAG TPA: histidine--tRNA ligase [Candidatus Omnitrophota bacterium]|nr:histidine--tRNA ligase [Candidatus Omnitrophota bacterium]